MYEIDFGTISVAGPAYTCLVVIQRWCVSWGFSEGAVLMYCKELSPSGINHKYFVILFHVCLNYILL